MQVRIVPAEDVTTVQVSGKLNTVTAPEFDRQVSVIPDSATVSVDMSDLEFISSAGIRSIISMVKKMDGRVKVMNAKGLVREVFVVSGIQDLMEE